MKIICHVCFSVAHGSVSIDQAALTGESLPVNKSAGDEIFSGSTCKQGEAEAIGLLKKCCSEKEMDSFPCF